MGIAKPYTVEFQDSTTVEDLTEKELRWDSLAAVQPQRSIRLNVIANTYYGNEWDFPYWLANLYSKFS